MLTAAIMSGGCDMLGLSSKPAPTPAPVEKEAPAAATTPAAANGTATTPKASPAAKPASSTRQGRKRAPGAVTAATGVTPPVNSSSQGVSPEVAAVDSNPSLDSRVGAHSTATPAPFITGPRPAPGDERRIYSKADEDVIPARLLKAQTGGPIFRNMAGRVNTMELIISKQGRVEEVKLTTPAKKMTDMLLLSGAKTWEFVPATKDGQPVRYRTQFSWEDTP